MLYASVTDTSEFDTPILALTEDNAEELVAGFIPVPSTVPLDEAVVAFENRTTERFPGNPMLIQAASAILIEKLIERDS